MIVQLDHTIYKIDDAEQADIAGMSFKGKETADTAFFYCSPSAEIGQEQQLLIDNIITKGLNLAMDDVLLVNVELSAVKTFNRINRIFTLKKIVFLGLSPSEVALNLDIQKNDVVNFNGKKLLFTDTLDNFIKQPDAKKAFWLALQQMFKLK